MTAGGISLAPGGGEAGPQERPAFLIKCFLELAVVQFEFRTVRVVTRAHRISPGLNVHFTRAFIPSQFIGTVKLVRHVSSTVTRRMPRLRLAKPRHAQPRAYCLSIVCSNFEKHGHCLSATAIRVAMQQIPSAGDSEGREK